MREVAATDGACVKRGPPCDVVVHVVELHVTYAWMCLLSSPRLSFPLPQKAWWELMAHLTCPCRVAMRACWAWPQCRLTPQGGLISRLTTSVKACPGTLACFIRVRGRCPGRIQSWLSCWRRGLPGPQGFAKTYLVFSEQSKLSEKKKLTKSSHTPHPTLYVLLALRTYRLNRDISRSNELIVTSTWAHEHFRQIKLLSFTFRY